jgi:hypothetical protein
MHMHVIVVMVGLLGAAMFAADAHAMYQPSTCRWMQRDPRGYGDGASLYEYVLSQVVLFTDPSGLSALAVPPATQPERKPWQRDDSTCCADAKANPKVWGGDGGGVICCDGRVVGCSWHTIPSGPPGSKKGWEIITECTKRHEAIHKPDVHKKLCDLDNEAECKVLYRLGILGDSKPSECRAYTDSMKCLLESYKQCNGDKDCLDALTTAWDGWIQMYGVNCGKAYPGKKPW